MPRRVIGRSPKPGRTGCPPRLFKRVIRGITKPRPTPPQDAAAERLTVEQVRDLCDAGLMVEVVGPQYRGEQGMIFKRLGPDRWQILLDRGCYQTFETKEIYPAFVDG